MKFIGLGIISGLVVFLYMVMFNHSVFSWIPVVYLMITFVYWYGEYTSALWAACIAGVFMDMHFHYSGVYLALYLVAVIMLILLERRISHKMSVASFAIGTGVVSLWSLVGLWGASGLLYGFVIYRDILSFGRFFWLLGATWLTLYSAHMCWRMVVRMQAYARR